MPSPKKTSTKPRAPVAVAPGAGREYDLGPVRAVFKADGAETAGGYAISEWWLAPRTRGPGAHAHDDDDVFYILDGTMSIRIGDDWFEATRGALLIAPGGVPHDCENRSGRRAGMLNVSIPGNFEEDMPGIAAWFRARPPRDARTAARNPAAARLGGRGRGRVVSRGKRPGHGQQPG
jgi:mannose-6-phosphate isomerase-like protein (cupin superfamily)